MDWIPLKKVIDVITKKKWSWTKNPRCKYINIRVDTRDLKCVISDRNDNEITLEDLEKQD